MKTYISYTKVQSTRFDRPLSDLKIKSMSISHADTIFGKLQRIKSNVVMWIYGLWLK